MNNGTSEQMPMALARKRKKNKESGPYDMTMQKVKIVNSCILVEELHDAKEHPKEMWEKEVY